MVFFTCIGCGESLKKAQVEQHRSRCWRSAVVSCIDCHKDFHGDQYREHTKCITENQKYGGQNYVAKENKGEVKQEQWLKRVQKAIENTGANNKALRSLLERLRNYPNIPRKQTKFESFLNNSLKIRDHRLASDAWLAICAAMPAEEETNATANAEQKKRPADDDEAVEAKKQRVDSDGVAANGTDGPPKTKAKFNWRKAIRSHVKQAPEKRMKLKRLRKEVISQCPSGEELTDDQLKDSFQQALQRLISKQVLVLDGKIIRSAAQ